MQIIRVSQLIFAGAMTAFAAACGGGGGNAPGTSTLKLAVTDAPVDDATSVVIEFTGVEIKPQGGEAFSIDFAPRQIDLLNLQGTSSLVILQGANIPAGDYNYLRLKVNAGRDASDSYIDLADGTRHALFIPSGNQSGLKLNGGFSAPANGIADFTIDFDLRKSVHAPKGQDGVYILRPTLRLVTNSEVGSLAGTVNAARVTALDCSSPSSPAVFVYLQSNIVPDDEYFPESPATDPNAASRPLTTALPTLNTVTGNYDYVVGFLPAGSYTVAFTCNAANDDPTTDDSIAFQNPTNVAVTTGNVTTVDFNP